MSTDRTQWGPVGSVLTTESRFCHTDRLSSINKMFIIWPNKNLNLHNVNGSCSWTFCLQTAMKHLDKREREGRDHRQVFSISLASFIDLQNILTGVEVAFIGVDCF